MTRITDAAPVQYEGTVDGKYFYFRARWYEWSFTVADSLEDAIDGFSTGGIFIRTGTYGDSKAGDYAASWMPHEEAERLIRVCAQEYLTEKNREELP